MHLPTILYNHVDARTGKPNPRRPLMAISTVVFQNDLEIYGTDSLGMGVLITH
jgi:hypothetical protein